MRAVIPREVAESMRPGRAEVSRVDPATSRRMTGVVREARGVFQEAMRTPSFRAKSRNPCGQAGRSEPRGSCDFAQDDGALRRNGLTHSSL